MGKNVTQYMQDYIMEVFNIVLNLYKTTVSELVSEALKIDASDVNSLTSDEVMKRLNNLQINYRVVDEKDKERIWYHDLYKQKLLAKMLGEKLPDESDELRMYLYEPDILQKTSVEDIKKARTEKDMSKIICDINFISHEMAHAFEHNITENPSYIDGSIYLLENHQNMIDYDIGEAFAMSMERIILDKLKEKGQIDLYELTDYVTLNDIEDVWNKKRINPSLSRGVIGKSKEGRDLIDLDLDLIPYEFIKNEGMASAIDYMKRINYLELYKTFPSKDDADKISEFYDDAPKKELLIPEMQKYEPVYSMEYIFNLMKKMQSINGFQVKSTQELGREILPKQKDTESKDREDHFIMRERQELEEEMEGNQRGNG